jgi:hypothetical protein
MASYLYQPVTQHEEKDLRDLINEILHVSGLETLPEQNFVPFLIFCQNNRGHGAKRIPFRTSRAYPGYLETPIAKIQSEPILDLCGELAGVIYESLEFHRNRKLMAFLNHVVLTLDRRARSPVKKRRTRSR